MYASPWTPSLGDWGFQYHPNEGRDFSISENVDVVVTHGPPLGIMDYTLSRERAGCPSLFAAVARARPRLHCFGHIHEGWGAKLVTWRETISNTPSHFTDINNDKSIVLEKLSNLKRTKIDTQANLEEKSKRLETYWRERCCKISLCHKDANVLRWGSQTLFINAAIEGDEEQPVQMPWVIDLELPAVALA